MCLLFSSPKPKAACCMDAMLCVQFFSSGSGLLGYMWSPGYSILPIHTDLTLPFCATCTIAWQLVCSELLYLINVSKYHWCEKILVTARSSVGLVVLICVISASQCHRNVAVSGSWDLLLVTVCSSMPQFAAVTQVRQREAGRWLGPAAGLSRPGTGDLRSQPLAPEGEGAWRLQRAITELEFVCHSLF